MQLMTEGEIELDPTETAPAAGGNAQTPGVRPSTPFARAVDHNPPGPVWRRYGESRPARDCPKCGIRLPESPPAACENCGAALA